MTPRRRAFLNAFFGALPSLALPGVARALPPANIVFPRDHGAHPGYRTEWWYLTGFATAAGREFGFQVTFFRSRVDATQAMTSKFAAKQLVFAHAAITDVSGRRLLHDQRIAREGFDIAAAAEGDTRLKLRDWSLRREAGGPSDAAGHALRGGLAAHWRALLPAEGFTLDLRFTPTQPVLLQGAAGLSRKGPDPRQASYYYSQPQLAASGKLTLEGKDFALAGKAWMDHEWSEELLHPDAVGWDWIGMNLDDGSALTAFRLRRKDGSTLWDGGSFRTAGGSTYSASRGENEFSPQRRWTSPATGASYPVEWIVKTPADFYTVKAVIDNQELDSRASTGAIYWEGLSDLYTSNGKRVGRGYLEMTGYAQRLRM